MRYILDIETTGLLDSSLDYSQLPYKLKHDFRVWCIVIRNISNGEITKIRPDDLSKETLRKSLEDATEIIGHNLIAFDLPVLQLYGLLDYTVGYPYESSLVFGKEVKITDTLLLSKLLNADRRGGHSLEAWGKTLGEPKGDFDDWSCFSEEMLTYCVQDTRVNQRIMEALEKEMKGNDWSRAIMMETKLADLMLKQGVFGFEFDMDLALKNIEVLDGYMETISKEINPLLPPKPLTQAALKEFTPPKLKFKADGNLSANMLKFLQKHSIDYSLDTMQMTYEGKQYPLAGSAPLKTHAKATVNDVDVVKTYLLQLGWVPSEIKERDLVKNPNKSQKSPAEIAESIDRYVKNTETSPFKDIRLDHFGVSMGNLRGLLMGKIQGTRPIYVPTSPMITIGLDKEICPNLVALGEQASFVGQVVKYYTYRHRKSSIAGGDVDEDGNPTKGYISAIREDGRIPTPADTLGTPTGRYRHRVVVNVPRVTSLFGKEMRSLFKAGKGFYQLGFDFASLEARIMGNYIIPYKDGEALAEALVAEKPNDIHSINARKLGIPRDQAKSLTYAVLYGAQPKKIAKMLGIPEKKAKVLFDEYWASVPSLKQLKDRLELHWSGNGKQFIKGLDGRLLNTRSQHSLLNVLFQGGGAIAAKWSSVLIAKELEVRGLLGNPFVDTDEEHKVYFLIAYHDEMQMAVHPKLLEVIPFDTEDEAKEFLVDKEGYSAIGHGKKGYYVSPPTNPVECIGDGIEKAVQELAMKTELGFEWIAGSSWAQCH